MGRSRLSRAIATAAVLLAAAVIATTQFVHPTLQTSAVTPDDPPTGVALLYLQGAQPHTLVAYDWSGRRRGSITVPSWVLRQDIHVAADGGAFRIDPPRVGNSDAYYLDRLGRVVLQTNNDSFNSQVWADDYRHLCLYDGSSIVLRLPGDPDRPVAVAADDNLAGSITLDACTVRGDLALFQSLGAPTSLAIVRLSTGAELNSGNFGAANVIPSVDAGYVAITAQGGNEPTMIYRTADLNHAVGQLDPTLQPVAFSGDDTEMLVTVPSDTGQAIEAFDWRAQRVSWRYDQSGTTLGVTVARPLSNEFAIQIVHPNGRTLGVVIARSNGSTIRLPYGIPVMVNN